MKRLYSGKTSVDERHRHRYEVNPDLISDLENAGCVFVGKDETGQRCEILELEGHPYFVAVNTILNSNQDLENQVHHSMVC